MRYKQVKTGLPDGTETTLYIDKAYEEITQNGVTKKRSYLGDAILTETIGGTDAGFKIGFVHRDRLNSTVTITNQDGNVVDNKSFDPFGKPREGTFKRVDSDSIEIPATLELIRNQNGYEEHTNRGFTDHEHLDDAELIHMNGRVYDYNLGRFLSVDPFVASPGNSQAMNPYSYVMNNPLAGTDPSGYAVVWDRKECESRGGNCDAEVGEVLSKLGFEVSNGKVNLSSNNVTKSSISDLLSDRKDDILGIENFKGKKNFGSRSISGGTFYRINYALLKDKLKATLISASDIQKNDTVFTNGILNTLNDAMINGRDHIFQVDGSYSDFVLFYNPTLGIFSDALETNKDRSAFESGEGFSNLALQLGAAMKDVNADGKNVRFIGHSQGGAITASASRYAFDTGGSLSNIRIALHGAPINDKFAAASFKRFGISKSAIAFRAQKHDPVHNILGNNGSFGRQFKSLFQLVNLFRDRTHSPHTLPCKPDPKATCN